MLIDQDRKPYQVSRQFVIDEIKNVNAHKQWHYHQYFELFFVNACTGLAFIGNTVKHISSGDIILVGPNLPHAFELMSSPNAPFAYPDTKLTSIRFESEFFQEEILYTKEFLPIITMFNTSRKGLGFTNDKSITYLGTQLNYKEGSELLLLLINILDQLSKKQDIEDVSASSMYEVLFDKSKRLNVIIDHLRNNFASNLRIQDMAALTHMTSSSFCRYFKQQMDKSFTGYLNELRMQEAMRLMQINRRSVGEIAQQVGFKSITNFNRQFKQLTTMTPLQYRKNKLQ